MFRLVKRGYSVFTKGVQDCLLTDVARFDLILLSAAALFAAVWVHQRLRGVARPFRAGHRLRPDGAGSVRSNVLARTVRRARYPGPPSSPWPETPSGA